MLNNVFNPFAQIALYVCIINSLHEWIIELSVEKFEVPVIIT